jgi:predicted aspartyl protease
MVEQSSVGPILANVIDSPPLDGFVPFVTVSVTDAHTEDPWNPYNSDACDANYVVGNYLTDAPEVNFAKGIFDTGASASLMSYEDAYLTGVDPNYVTSSLVILQGAASSAYAWASQPLGIFLGGIDMLDSNGLLLDDSDLAGEYNVSIIVGDPIESPYVPTAIGAPFAIFFSTVFCNNKQIPVEVDGNDVNSPRVRVYAHDDSRIPYYPNKIYLELRPSSVGYIQYFPCIYIPGILECPDGDGSPLTPTIIVDGMWLAQALFFVSSVDVTNKGHSAIDKDGFMYDTGAQVTVLSEAICARLELDPHDPCFVVPITDVTGQVTDVNGYYVDSLEIVGSPWLSFTNVPVLMLDVNSPEGGILDGIIGMNLFNELNFVFRGGGLFGMGAPLIRYEPVCRVTGDIAPFCGDCTVDNLDLGELCAHWLDTPSEPDWNPDADLAPIPAPDEHINIRDYAVLALHWLETVSP